MIATIDLGSLGYYDEEEMKNVISRAMQRGFIGKYRVNERGFTFRPFGGKYYAFTCTNALYIKSGRSYISLINVSQLENISITSSFDVS